MDFASHLSITRTYATHYVTHRYSCHECRTPKGGIPLDVHAVANIKVSSDETIIGNAIERFLGQDSKEINEWEKKHSKGTCVVFSQL